MAAHAPVEILQFLDRVTIDGKSPQEHEAAAVLDLVERGREIPREGREGKVVPAEVGPPEALTSELPEGGLHLLDGPRRDGDDPVRGPCHVAAEPRLPSHHRFHVEGAHIVPFSRLPRNSRTIRRNSSSRSWCSQWPAPSMPKIGR